MGRKTIPKNIKNNVWDKYIGIDKGIGQCYCCKKEIDSKHFECGHIIAHANGGATTVENMRPLCSVCNKSIGKQNMNEFIEIYFSTKKNEISQNTNQNDCNNFCHCKRNPYDTTDTPLFANTNNCILCKKILRCDSNCKLLHVCSNRPLNAFRHKI